MQQIVAEFGWPTSRLVGPDGMRAAWLLVQHADHDVDSQKKCLSMMKKHINDDQVAKADVAYLTDRVAVNEQKPQYYGI